VRTILDPIPEAYRYLAPAFYQETLGASRRIIRAGSILFGVSLVLFAVLVYEPYLTYPELIFLDITSALVCISWFILSYQPISPRLLQASIFGGAMFILLSNMRESLVHEDFMSVFLIALTGAFFGIILPWPTIWTVFLELATITASLSMFFYWEPFLIGPLVTIILFCLTSVAVHFILTHQRWDNFLNRYHIEQLNRELRTANEQLREHSNRLESELALARNIQQGLLPPPNPFWPGLDVMCHSMPALEIGGDFYSYYAFSHEHVAIAVGDVSGKGVAAALLMATGMSLLASTLSQDLQPGERLALLDEAFSPYTSPRGQNCALCYVELHKERLRIVNAGGIPPYIRRLDGRIEMPDAHGVALGHGWGARNGYEEVEMFLLPGDLVVLTSDGIVESMNEKGELFGFERLEQSIANGPIHSVQAMLSHILADITHFVGGNNTPNDDVTIVVFRVEAEQGTGTIWEEAANVGGQHKQNKDTVRVDG
jgi:serine phosphatase RsbU (regulator of sigma subunit)